MKVTQLTEGHIYFFYGISYTELQENKTIIYHINIVVINNITFHPT